MHEINNINKRARTLRNFRNYFLIGLLILALALVLVLAARGYDIDRNTGRIIQNGILIVESEPSGAEVYLNDEKMRGSTNEKYAIPTGEYVVRLEKDGYRTWQRQVVVPGSSVLWLNYPRLVPSVVDTGPRSAVGAVNFLRYNYEREQAAVANSANVQTVSLYSVDQPSLPLEQYTIPNSLLRQSGGETVGRVSFLGWSLDGAWLALNYTAAGRTDMLVLNLDDPSLSLNLRTALGQAFDTITFIPNSQAVLTRGATAYRVDLNDPTLGEPIAQDVVHVAGSDEAWLEILTEIGSAVVHVDAPDQPVIERNEPSKALVASQWEGQNVLAFQDQTSVSVFRNIDRSGERNVPEKVITLNNPIDSILASPEGRFLLIRQTEASVVYDLERQLTFRHAHGSRQYTRWLDAHRLVYDADGQMEIVDFNAANTYQITSFDGRFGAYADQGNTSIISIGSSAVNGQNQLRRSSLELE